ncbi:hypothetical protein CUJ84_pRLN3000038 (plasmid) [Rhizobium leguminosarum]|uniref:Uncharacterized protein n=1 Tax=Rhizobium leguminosarum TaxID=384 RepID=A0A2K9ZFZ8_RHILE|nr:hypothetical protein CUJ84_pRLN3000038 [Rhizobium leguminosarum]
MRNLTGFGSKPLQVSTSSRQVAFSLLDTGGLFGSHFNEAISGSAADDFGVVTLRAVQDYVQ